MAAEPERVAPRTARDLARLGREFLERKGLEEARLEAELLVAAALGLERLQLFLELDRPVEEAEVDRARELLVRRGKGEPTAYVVGEREFYGRGFRVTPAVLVPRPETELVVDRARELAREVVATPDGPRVLDVGTGSGCLAITLALELPGSVVEAVDVSAAALAVAAENAERLGATVALHEGDGLAPVQARGAAFDLIVSNPPYVDPAGRADLPPEVRDHEPALALFAPDGDPDHWARKLATEAPPLLRPGGALLVELGYDQAERLRPWLAERGLEPTFHRDLARLERVLELRAAP